MVAAKLRFPRAWRRMVVLLVTFCGSGLGQEDSAPREWRELFDGKSLTGWTSTAFGGEGDVAVESGVITLGFGAPLTGITWSGGEPLPHCDYELEVEARRRDGSDFFCGLTFPYRDSHCTLILGGWGGSLVGLSSLDRQDASENETTRHINFEKDRWYKARIQVREGEILAWLDDRPIVKCQVGKRSVGTRFEVELSKPLGIAAYETRAEVRRVRVRALPAAGE